MDRINNNIKFYTFIDILETYSDKNVSLSIKEINNHMKKRLGVMLDRRTIYNYMRDMKALGFDVSDYDKNKEGYYLNSHSLEPHEIKILSDAVLSSNFITKEKSLELLDKLKSFNSIYQNRNFIDNIFIEDIPKSTNEEIFSNMVVIDKAIKDSKKIMFNYCNYDCYKNLVYRVDSDGVKKVYVKSPVYMILRKQNYYLVCADESSDMLQNYRVDRMLNVSVMDEDSMDLSEFRDCRDGFNPMDYLRKSFKMFTGENAIVIIVFGENLLNYLLDEFGDYIYIMKKNDFESNNLSEEIRWDSFDYQILSKILGKKEYENYILTGKYMEDSSVRDKIEDFRKELRRIVDAKNVERDVDKRNVERDVDKRNSKVNVDIERDVHARSVERDIGVRNYEKDGDRDYKVVDLSSDGSLKEDIHNKEGKTTYGENRESKDGYDVDTDNRDRESKDGYNVDTDNKEIKDDEQVKKYIGIFVAKSGVGLAKWIMQFGADIKVVFPESLRQLIKAEIDEMSEYYSE